MKIQDIIDKFNKLPHGTLGEFDEDVIGFCEAEQFLQSSLTSLLDSIKADIEKTKEEVKKQTGSYKYDDQYDDCINIINSHK